MTRANPQRKLNVRRRKRLSYFRRKRKMRKPLTPGAKRSSIALWLRSQKKQQEAQCHILPS